MKEILTEWNILKKVDFAVSDNAPNIMNALKNELSYSHFGCYVHTLNLIIQKAVHGSESNSTIEKVKKIVAHFNRSPLSPLDMDKFLKFQANNGLRPKRLKQDIITRWNATYHMLQRFTELDESIRATVATLNGKDIPIITLEEWQLCRELCQILGPFEEMTSSISVEKYMSGSLVRSLNAYVVRAMNYYRIAIWAQ